MFTGASSVTVTRYRYRGTNIPTPWTMDLWVPGTVRTPATCRFAPVMDVSDPPVALTLNYRIFARLLAWMIQRAQPEYAGTA